MVLRLLKRFGKWGYHDGVYGLDFGSPVSHISDHLYHRWFLLFDLKNAFYSTSVSKVKSIIKLKFTERKKLLEARFELQKSRQLRIFDPPEVRINPDGWDVAELTSLIMEIVTYQGFLPQGAPTSPFLFRLSITESAKSRYGLYGLIKSIVSPWEISCYVDNFIISGSKPIPTDIREKVFDKISKRGFRVHKIYHRDLRHGSPTICGLRINYAGEANKIVLPKKTIRKWRGIIGRARFDHSVELRRKINGFLASLRPIYGDKPLPQISQVLTKLFFF
mgnify:CR=1 FL=1